MDASTEKQVKEFIDLLNKLFAQIRDFLKDTYLRIEDTEVDVTEERSGKYKAPSLSVSAKGTCEIVKIVPAGTWFIASRGIVDIKGKVGTESLVFMDKGGPVIRIQSGGGNQVVTHTTFVYKGIDKEGWYWIEDKKQHKAKLLSKDLLFNLISSVSDYEFKS